MVLLSLLHRLCGTLKIKRIIIRNYCIIMRLFKNIPAEKIGNFILTVITAEKIGNFILTVITAFVSTFLMQSCMNL